MLTGAEFGQVLGFLRLGTVPEKKRKSAVKGIELILFLIQMSPGIRVLIQIIWKVTYLPKYSDLI